MTGNKIIAGALSLTGVLVLGASLYLNSLLPIITGYDAKNPVLQYLSRQVCRKMFKLK
jgi:hypothetical protein